MLKNANFVAIDFETANSKWSSACSIGYAIVENGEIIKYGEHLIKPEPFYFDDRNIGIHGIRAKDVENSPNLIDVWNSIYPLFGDKPIVAHNASFDIGVLRHGFDAFNMDYPEFKYLCTYRLAQAIWPDESSHRLNNLGRKIGLQFNHHQAKEDALVCAHLLLNFLKEYEVDNIDDLLSKMNINFGEIWTNDYNAFSFESKKAYTKSYKPKFLKSDNPTLKILDIDNIFKGKKVVVTGTFDEYPRSKVEEYLRQMGASIIGSVSKKTDFLICGGKGFTHDASGKPSSKYVKCMALQSEGSKIQLLSENDFLEVLNSCSEKSECDLSNSKDIVFDFHANASNYDIDWALKYREYHPSFENVALYLNESDYTWNTSDNIIELFGSKYNMKITFHDIKDNTIEIENVSNGKKLKPFRRGSIEGMLSEIEKRII